MNIKTNDKTYIATRDSNGWTLQEPIFITDKKTQEKKSSYRSTYHITAGDLLAKISDLEMGTAKDIDDLRAKIESLRTDLLKSNL